MGISGGLGSLEAEVIGSHLARTEAREVGGDRGWGSRFHALHDAAAEALVKHLGAGAYGHFAVSRVVKDVVVDDAFTGSEDRTRWRWGEGRFFVGPGGAMLAVASTAAAVSAATVSVRVRARGEGARHVAALLDGILRQIREESAGREVLGAPEERARRRVRDEEALAGASDRDVGETALLVELVHVAVFEAAVGERLFFHARQQHG